MKNFTKLFIAALVFSALFCACNDSPEPPPGESSASTEELKQSDMAANDKLR